MDLRVIRQDYNFVGTGFSLIRIVDKGYSMGNKVVDVCLVAVAALVFERSTINNTSAVRSLRE